MGPKDTNIFETDSIFVEDNNSIFETNKLQTFTDEDTLNIFDEDDEDMNNDSIFDEEDDENWFVDEEDDEEDIFFDEEDDYEEDDSLDKLSIFDNDGDYNYSSKIENTSIFTETKNDKILDNLSSIKEMVMLLEQYLKEE